ncbi:MAG: hypothetical protein JW937_07920 [Candidatus Omnitrophica bacterium]|nr:hypothetical protein [Candidatus Omnitrophota bacterium]
MNDYRPLCIEVGGVSLLLEIPSFAHGDLQHHYRDFLCEDSINPALRVSVHLEKKDVPDGASRILDGVNLELHQLDSQYFLRFRRDTAVAVLSESLDAADLYIEYENLSLLYRILPEFLISTSLPRHGGLLVHASGVVGSKGGVLFAGPSGEGKTTLAAIAEERGFAVINDDRIVIRRSGSGFWMHGTPWWGEFREQSALESPLDFMFFLVKDSRSFVEEISKSRAAALLMENSFGLSLNSIFRKARVDLCTQILDGVGTAALHSKGDGSIWEALNEYLA